MLSRKLLSFVTTLLALWQQASAQSTIVDSFIIDGVYRSYRFHIPPSTPTTARPLVLNLHGYTSNALEQELYTNFSAVADTAGFFVVYPQGTYVGNVAFWDVDYPGAPTVNDVKFLSTLIDTLARRYPIDLSRVYATGFSNGGYMSHILGIRLNNKLAAIASVAGTMVQSVYASGNPGRAVPAMQIHGTSDGTVSYAGDATSVAVDSVVQFWVRNNSCNTTPVKTAVPDIVTADGCTAERLVWSGGSNGSTVELFKVTSGGHSWPGAPPVVGVTNRDFSASREIWRFFSQYRLPLSNAGIETPGVALHLLKNPVKDILKVDAAIAGSLTITDMAGRSLIRSEQMTVDVAQLASGTYLLQLNTSAGRSSIPFVKE